MVIFICVLFCLPVFAFFQNMTFPKKVLHSTNLVLFSVLWVSFVIEWFAMHWSQGEYYLDLFQHLVCYAPFDLLVGAFTSFGLFEWTRLLFIFGWDVYSLLFVALTIFIFFLVSYYSAHTVVFKERLYVNTLLFLFISLNLIFSALNLLIFYIFFEVALLPMFILIGIWGGRTRKIRASLFFFMYTAIFSFFFLFALMNIWNWFGTYDYLILRLFFFKYFFFWGNSKMSLIWLCFFLTFIVKLPTIPFHIWLPEAHVEASTAGSVILASILLKLGGYGILRFLLPNFLSSQIYFLPIVYVIATLSIIYSTFMAIAQVDLKKIIAYSSIAHMNFSLLGLFSFSIYGISGSMFLFLGHGFISAALFFLVGSLYTRLNTRLLKYYSGFINFAPTLSFFFCFFPSLILGFQGRWILLVNF